MLKIWSKIKNFYITNSQREREISGTREILVLPKREMDASENKNNRSVSEVAVSGSLEGNAVPSPDNYCQYSKPENLVKSEHSASEVAVALNAGDLDATSEGTAAKGESNLDTGKTNKNTAVASDALVSSSVARNSDLPSTDYDNKLENLVNSDSKNLTNAVEVGGIAPPDSWMVSPSPHCATPTAPSLYQEKSVLSQSCPYCASKNFVKRGTRQKKSGKTQLYICNDCQRTFTPSWTKNRQHSWSTILEAISYYNLGFSLAQTCDIMKQKFEVEVQPSTIATWVEDNKEICAYHRMRDFAVKHFSPYEVVETCTLAHRQLYRFRYHHAKIKYIMEDDFKHYKFYPLKEWLDNVATETPHQYFQEGERMSEVGTGRQKKQDATSDETATKTSDNLGSGTLKFSKTEMIVRAKENYATKLTELVFQGVSENKARHEALQRFLIANDTVTVATEVPVYIKREDLAHMQTQLGFKLYKNNKNVILGKAKDLKDSSSLDGLGTQNDKRKKENKDEDLKELNTDEIPKLITGHIDFLQIRNGSVHILDYKSNAAKERPIEQLTLYALALSRLTGLRLFYFKCAWFDEKDYFEFFPLHVVYKPGRGRKKIYTKEGVYDMNEKMNKMESLRPVFENRKTIIGTPNF